MKILVTGASGFFGTHLVPRLVAAGHEVRTFGRSPSKPAQFADLEIEHAGGEITDREAVGRALSGRDLVYHMAGLVSYRAADRQRQQRVNVEGTRTVMELALAAGVSRVIHTGSIAGMGIPEPGTIGTEEIAYNLAGRGLNYCDSKHAAEQEVLRLAGEGLPAIMLNPGIVFGEGDTHPHHRAIFAALASGWLIGWPGGGVSFCDIEDVVGAHLNAMTMGRVGQRYVLSSENLTFRDAAATVTGILGSPPPSFEIPGWLLELAGTLTETLAPLFGRTPSLTRQVAWLSQQRIFFSADKAISELAYRQTPFAETIKRTAPYYLGVIGGSARVR